MAQTRGLSDKAQIIELSLMEAVNKEESKKMYSKYKFEFFPSTSS
jgi:hypothetical protein